MTKEKEIDISALINQMDPENFKVLNEENIHLSLSDNFTNCIKNFNEEYSTQNQNHQIQESLYLKTNQVEKELSEIKEENSFYEKSYFIGDKQL